MATDALRDLADQLSGLDATPCGFIHEKSERVQPATCPASMQETRLGCAHAAQHVLLRAIDECNARKLATSEEIGRWKAQLGADNVVLMTLDGDAVRAYEKGALDDDTLRGQRSIIDRRVCVRDELVKRLKSASL
jgi:hypothetical protein